MITGRLAQSCRPVQVLVMKSQTDSMQTVSIKGRGTGFVCFAIIAACWVWQLLYGAFAGIVQLATDPPKCVSGWIWPEPLPWTACRGFGLSDQVQHWIGIPGDLAMYPFALWPYAMSSGLYSNPMFWLNSAIHVLALWWLANALVRRVRSR